MDEIMADEKTGTDESKNTKPTVNETGAPGIPVAPVSIPSPAHPPVSHIMPHDGVIADEAPLPNTAPPVAQPIPAPQPTTPKAPTKKASVIEDIPQRKKVPSLKAVLAPEILPSPEHPPVSHIMPREEVIPTGPILVPPGGVIARLLDGLNTELGELDCSLRSNALHVADAALVQSRLCDRHGLSIIPPHAIKRSTSCASVPSAENSPLWDVRKSTAAN